MEAQPESGTAGGPAGGFADAGEVAPTQAGAVAEWGSAAQAHPAHRARAASMIWAGCIMIMVGFITGCFAFILSNNLPLWAVTGVLIVVGVALLLIFDFNATAD